MPPCCQHHSNICSAAVLKNVSDTTSICAVSASVNTLCQKAGESACSTPLGVPLMRSQLTIRACFGADVLWRSASERQEVLIAANHPPRLDIKSCFGNSMEDHAGESGCHMQPIVPQLPSISPLYTKFPQQVRRTNP